MKALLEKTIFLFYEKPNRAFFLQSNGTNQYCVGINYNKLILVAIKSMKTVYAR